MVMINKLAWKIGGEAGYGIMGTGQMFAKLCMRSGLYAFMTHDYPSLIRGGHNTSSVRAQDVQVTSHTDNYDILVALNKETIDLHKNEVTENGGIIYDNEETKLDDLVNGVRLFGVPLMKISREIAGERLLRNTVALGASVALFKMDIDLLNEIIKETYSKKGENVLKMNIEAAKRGYEYIRKNYGNDFKIEVIKKERKNTIFLTGNEAISIAAIKAGLKFHAQYPMTPSSQILQYLINKANDYGVVALQLEDEISVINTALGASWAGARSMVATSGGGFCLMSEAFGLAGMVELPLVIIMGQRGGPATGLPTKTEQGDLKFVLNAAQGEFPRIVAAPGDVEECFYLTLDAFNLADQLQNPVIILHDQYLANNGKTVEKFNTLKYRIERGLIISDKTLENVNDFKRYKHEDGAVTWRSLPGQKNGMYSCGSDEHDEYGQICEDPENRNRIMQRRMRKLEYAKKLIGTKGVNFYGPEAADLTLVGWGSTKGRILEAVKQLNNKGIKTNFLQIVYMSPFPARQVTKVLEKSKKILLFEENYSGQLGGLIAEHTGVKIKNLYTKYSGVPFSPTEIYEKAKLSFKDYI
ncbi:MAG TPA: 2-oxoacid:acceptor oxidoreductase subunit alpha [Candidatus Nanoarchaeia archaeon]|nr:2-oxoacid:acceptor oxidoreductase subunit alpha [Candidatus Nanoarchaeia archaeon]